METWRRVWREGLLPSLSTAALRALRDGLMHDDPSIVQGSSVSPAEGEVATTCAICFAIWRGDKCRTVSEVEEQFIQACLAADARMGCPGASRWFLNWFDDGQRDVVFRCLLAEVNLALKRTGSPGESGVLLRAA